MIISRGRRYIFLHIPKTGGTALSLALEARAMADDILIGDTPKAQKRRKRLEGIKTHGRLWKHSTLSDIEGLVRREDFASFEIFTLVRNPWDRMVSYYHWLKDQSFVHPAVAAAQTLTFDAFLRDPRVASGLRANPARTYATDSTGHVWPCTCLRLERFAEAVVPIEAHLGFALSLAQVNRSERERDYRRYYTDDLAAYVGDLLAEDVARFGYQFDP